MNTKSYFRPVGFTLLLVIFTAVPILLASCGPGQAVGPTLTPTPTITLTTTSTSTYISTTTFTLTPTSTITYTPTVTSTPAATPIPVELTLWYAYADGSDEKNAMGFVLANAAIDMPQVKIKAVQVLFSEIFFRYRTEVAAGAGPDLFVAPNDNLGYDVRLGDIADITSLAEGRLGDYAPLSVQGMTVAGKLYGIPESLKAVAFWYDKTRLAAPPATTNDLKDLMTGGNPISIIYDCYYDWGFFGAFGGTVFDSNWKIAATNPGMIDAMTYLDDLYQISKASSWPTNNSDGYARFTQGGMLGLTEGNWRMGDFKNVFGSRLAVAALPAGPSGPATPLLGVDGYYINPNSQKKAAAVDLALYLTGKTAEERMMVAGHVPAITTAPVTDPLIKSLQDIFKNGYVRPQVTQMDVYWMNFCSTDSVFKYGIDPATWLKDATAASNP